MLKSLIKLCALGKPELVARWRAGKLRPREVWVAARGAAKYQAAVARGDVASVEDQDGRFIGKCLGCHKRTETHVEDGLVSHWCGEPLVENKIAGTCGCLLGLTIDGVPVPGGKTVVASEWCWAGNWGAVARAVLGRRRARGSTMP